MHVCCKPFSFMTWTVRVASCFQLQNFRNAHVSTIRIRTWRTNQQRSLWDLGAKLRIPATGLETLLTVAHMEGQAWWFALGWGINNTLEEAKSCATYPKRWQDLSNLGNSNNLQHSRPGGVFQEIHHFHQLRFGTVTTGDISELHLLPWCNIL